MITPFELMEWVGRSHLIQRVGIKKNPSKLNDFSGVFGHIDTVLIASCSNMDDNIAINVELRNLLRRHDVGRSARGAQNEQRRRWVGVSGSVEV